MSHFFSLIFISFRLGTEHSADAEQVYQWHNGWIETDLHLKGLRPPNPAAEGTELEEHGFHYFLEKKIEPLTILQARANLREADVSKDGKISFLEFLLWKLSKTAVELCRRKPIDPMGVEDPSKVCSSMITILPTFSSIGMIIFQINILSHLFYYYYDLLSLLLPFFMDGS